MYMHCDHLFLCLIFILSLRWTIILVLPGRVYTRRPPYGVGTFLGGLRRMLVWN